MIDEKKLIEDIKEKVSPERFGESCNALDVIYAVLQVIDEQPKTDWIPCEERLPSDTAIHEVTAKFSNGTFYTEFAYYDESREEWWKFDDDGTVNVIAWKEHSEPYKADHSGEVTEMVTNADRIRNMTDEELADIVSDTCSCAEIMFGSSRCTKASRISCKECALKWLQAEVKEGITNVST